MMKLEDYNYPVKNGILAFQRGPLSCWWGGFRNQGKQPQFTDGILEYNCAEQYFMAAKAAMFGNNEKAQDILKEKNPKKQQQMGREVKNYNQSYWDDVKERVMYVANWMKYKQNPDLAALLKETGDLILAEASDFDTIWGIGLDASDERAFDQTQWRGQNLLGKTLMKVREELNK